MEFNFHIFGNPNREYSQYPNDNLLPTILTAAQRAGCLFGTGLVIHRESDVTYYIFKEEVNHGISGNTFIGFCLTFNGMQISKLNNLIYLFRFIVRHRLVETGELFRYTDEWRVEYRVENMDKCAELHERLKAFINREFEDKVSKYGIEPLTTPFKGIESSAYYKNYYEEINDGLRARGSFPPDEIRDAEIIALTHKHNFVFVHEEKGIESDYFHSVFNSLRNKYQILSEENKKLQGECQELWKENRKLQEENALLSKKKKQCLWIIFLFIVIIAGLMGLLFS